ncbi:MAG: BON domain-containing protein [Bacteriovorax sp.]
MNITKNILLAALALGHLAAFSAYPTSANEKPAAITADSQMKARAEETEMTRKLRERIMADNQLSTKAHNITIITVAKAITLRGPVASREEKVKIENYARSMAGDKRVYNQLTYK